MNTSESAILDLGSPGSEIDLGPSAASELQFQDFPRSTTGPQVPTSPKFNTSLADSGAGVPDDETDDDALLLKKSKNQGIPGAAFWETEFFRQIFRCDNTWRHVENDVVRGTIPDIRWLWRQDLRRKVHKKQPRSLWPFVDQCDAHILNCNLWKHRQLSGYSWC